ncbi:MAG: PfkB family carbohydrate kinase, partial [Nocardioidaceae bacterium]
AGPIASAHARSEPEWPDLTVGRILVVGDVVDDIVVRPLTAVTTASDTNAEIRMHPGGSAANVAAWLGRAGAPVTFVGRAGASGAARHAAALERFGVDARVVADPRHVTGTIVLTLDGAGERTMYVDRGANVALEPSDVPAHLWDEVAWLHLTGYSLFDDDVRPTALALIRTAHGRGVGVSVDPSSVAFLRDSGVERFLGWVDGADILLPNEDEGRLLTGEDTPVAIADALAVHARTVVLTLGAAGSLVRTAAGGVHRAPPADAAVVDTTGAGDAYCAGFLAAWNDGADPAGCMRSGAQMAAEVVAGVGARPALVPGDAVQGSVVSPAPPKERTMDAQSWEDRYRGSDKVFSGNPNGVLVTEASGLPPGHALDVGCGEGADAVWLARRGWRVTAVDISPTALQRAAAGADLTDRVEWTHADLITTPPQPGAFDLVSVQYFPLPHQPDHAALRGLLGAVAPGGTLLFVGHDLADLPARVGFDPSGYYQPDDIARILDDDWAVLVDETRRRAAPAPAGTHHTHDTVLRAQRSR